MGRVWPGDLCCMSLTSSVFCIAAHCNCQVNAKCPPTQRLGADCTVRDKPTIFSSLTFRWPAAGSLCTGLRFAPYGLLGYEFDGDSSANIRATQTPRAIASLKIIVCWGKWSSTDKLIVLLWVLKCSFDEYTRENIQHWLRGYTNILSKLHHCL